ncbi:uncharacterized protein [Venturia canescens]|uniref:uncharacterized protein n=1 Tax=Venturia canescens TaxID=32260 RepID=UPI001C9C0DFA|nr:uncharacterized protein LOC122408372 [Venturia canescens]
MDMYMFSFPTLRGLSICSDIWFTNFIPSRYAERNTSFFKEMKIFLVKISRNYEYIPMIFPCFTSAEKFLETNRASNDALTQGCCDQVPENLSKNSAHIILYQSPPRENVENETRIERNRLRVDIRNGPHYQKEKEKSLRKSLSLTKLSCTGCYSIFTCAISIECTNKRKPRPINRLKG